MSEISVIMPIYNSEKTLEKSILSLVNQKFDKNYEIILINDGSTDNSEKICQKYIKKYDYIKYKKINNMGVSNARNLGIEMSNSQYVMFIDSDDTYNEDTLRIMYNAIIENDSELVISGYKRINQLSGKEIIKKIKNSEYTKERFDELIEKAQGQNLFNQLWNKIFRLDIIRENKIKFDNSISLGEDYRFILNYIKYINKIINIDNVLYNYINSLNGLNTIYRKDRLDINISNLKILEEIYKENNYNMQYVNDKYAKACLSGINNICKNKNSKEKKEELTKFINNSFIRGKLINNSSNKRIIIKLLLSKSIIVLRFLGFITNIYDKAYRRIKLGY